MGSRSQQINSFFWAGIGASLLVFSLTIGSLAAVASKAEAFYKLNQSDLAIIIFTVKQALLSAFFSIFFAIPVARALARRDFYLKNLFISVLGAPFILPILVAVIGLVSIFGKSGFLNQFLQMVNLPGFSIYGLQGIVLAHVFFNLPLAVRLILHGWYSIPMERFRLSAQLNFNSYETFRFIEVPMLKSILPGIFGIIFLICLTSFAIALTLGGGPKATTIELAIYQAFRFDFNLSKAAIFAFIQFFICSLFAIVAFKFSVIEKMDASFDRFVIRWDSLGLAPRVFDTFIILSVVIFIFTPLISVVIKGAPGILNLPDTVWNSVVRSLFVALFASLLSVILGFLVSMAIVNSKKNFQLFFETVGYLPIVASPMVLGTGLFIIIFPIIDPRSLVLPITMLVNALMALPFSIRILLPHLKKLFNDYGKLIESLGFKKWDLIRIIILPKISKPLGFSFGLSAAISMGDFGVIALFSDPDSYTLPMKIYRLMASYRVNEAASGALLLLILTFGIFSLFDYIGRKNVKN